jgi:DNA/RNA endonuclease YhcR with UshA esterase domain
MRRFVLSTALAALSMGFVLAQDAAPLTPADAAKKVDQKVTVEFEVKSTGGKTAVYLNSEADFKSDKNFTVFLPAKAVEKFKAAKVDDPAVHFKGKTVRVTGTVTLFKEKPQIKVDGPDQIKLVEKK